MGGYCIEKENKYKQYEQIPILNDVTVRALIVHRAVHELARQCATQASDPAQERYLLTRVRDKDCVKK